MERARPMMNHKAGANKESGMHTMGGPLSADTFPLDPAACWAGPSFISYTLRSRAIAHLGPQMLSAV